VLFKLLFLFKNHLLLLVDLNQYLKIPAGFHCHQLNLYFSRRINGLLGTVLRYYVYQDNPVSGHRWSGITLTVTDFAYRAPPVLPMPMATENTTTSAGSTMSVKRI